MLLSDVVLLTYNDVVSLQSCDVVFLKFFSLKCGKQSVSVSYISRSFKCGGQLRLL